MQLLALQQSRRNHSIVYQLKDSMATQEQHRNVLLHCLSSNEHHQDGTVVTKTNAKGHPCGGRSYSEGEFRQPRPVHPSRASLMKEKAKLVHNLTQAEKLQAKKAQASALAVFKTLMVSAGQTPEGGRPGATADNYKDPFADVDAFEKKPETSTPIALGGTARNTPDVDPFAEHGKFTSDTYLATHPHAHKSWVDVGKPYETAPHESSRLFEQKGEDTMDEILDGIKDRQQKMGGMQTKDRVIRDRADQSIADHSSSAIDWDSDTFEPKG